MSVPSGYNETLLHWLWKNRHLQNLALSTCTGKKVTIHHPGFANPSDGPDFINARITIGSLMWHGDVEIHWRAEHWRHHHHHTDANYNRVILHVVYNDSPPEAIFCRDGSSPPALLMKPYLSKPLQYFFHHFQQSKMLPCAAGAGSIPEGVIDEQFSRAHREYFEQKVNDLLQFYEASLPLSQAWLHMLVIAIFDGLGISHNRKPMRALAKKLLADEIIPKEELIKKALKIAGIEPANDRPEYRWKHKGSRPANHPKARIPQACRAMCFILNRPFNKWLRSDIKDSFNNMRQSINGTPGIGSQRAGVLLGTVWVPAFYLLGDFTATQRLRRQAENVWQNHRTALAQSITKYFRQADIPPAAYAKKLGTVHQYRAYCKPRRCDQCDIFNFIISA